MKLYLVSSALVLFITAPGIAAANKQRRRLRGSHVTDYSNYDEAIANAEDDEGGDQYQHAYTGGEYQDGYNYHDNPGYQQYTNGPAGYQGTPYYNSGYPGNAYNNGVFVAEEEAASNVKDETAQLYGYYGNRDWHRRRNGTPWNVQPNGRPWNERPDGRMQDEKKRKNADATNRPMNWVGNCRGTLNCDENGCKCYEESNQYQSNSYKNNEGYKHQATHYDYDGNQYQQPNSSYKNNPGHQHRASYGSGNQYQSSGNPTQCFNYYDPNTCANRGCTWNANMCHP